MEQAEAILKAGDALIFPTDTVWGIGVAVKFAQDAQALAATKGRSNQKPIAWLVGSADALGEYGSAVPSYAAALADAFWPGPLTLVVKASSAVPNGFRAASGTIGLRMPGLAPIARLASAIESPLAVTSANFAGEPAVPSGEQLDARFVEASHAAVLALSERLPQGGIASTVVDCTASAPKLLRAGTISASEIESACGLPCMRADESPTSGR